MKGGLAGWARLRGRSALVVVGALDGDAARAFAARVVTGDVLPIPVDATDAARAMRDLGQPVPSGTVQSFQVMGRTFDPANPAPWTERGIRAS